MAKKKTFSIEPYLYAAALGILILLFLAPILWIAVSSFKDPIIVTQLPPRWIFKPSLVNYASLFVARGAITPLVTSLFVSVFSVLIALVAGVPAGYSLARFNIKRKDDLSFYFLAGRMAPPIAVVIPLYILFRMFGMLDNPLALIIVYTTFNLPLVIWICKGFFEEIPKELEEAAFIDGCSMFGSFYKIGVPLGSPGIVTSGILSFIFSWNEFLFALVLAGGKLKTIPVLAANLVTDRMVLWGELSAVAIVSFLPILLFAVLVQKYLLRGLTFGAVKG